MTLKQWKERKDLQSAWKVFMASEAFKEAILVLRDEAIPSMRPNDSPATLATRHAYMSGFHDCIKLLQSIPSMHTVASQAIVQKEWAYAAETPHKQ